MASRLNPYLSFKDNARDAMEFYKSVFGGELQIMTFGDNAHEPSEKDKVMHGQLETPSGFTLMGSDTPDRMGYKPTSGMTVSLSGDNESELKGYWDKLSAGGTIIEPLVKAPWGDHFGMLADKYGIPWMVNISGQQSQ
jgi:PhnB protein